VITSLLQGKKLGPTIVSHRDVRDYLLECRFPLDEFLVLRFGSLKLCAKFLYFSWFNSDGKPTTSEPQSFLAERTLHPGQDEPL
jgi:hypothetical protein